MKNPLRFCMITTFYPPHHFGGDAMHIYRLSNALARRGHRVDVIHDWDSYHLLHPDPPPGEFPNEPGVTLHTLRSRAGFFSPLATQQTGRPFFKTRAIEAVLEANAPDVIHFHNSSLIGGPGVLSLGEAVKLYTTHEHWLICPMHVLWKFGNQVCTERACLRCQIAGGRPPQWWRTTGLLERSMREVDLFLSPSRFTLDKHLGWGGLKIPMKHLPYYVEAPVEGEEEVDPDGSNDRRHPRPYFLTVGRLEKIKGFQNVIPVFGKYENADLMIAGEGSYESTLKEIGRGMERVHFLGHQSQKDLIRLYRGALALIVPSICYEVFGLVVIEAFTHRTPVIAHDLGALPEIIEESGGGLTYRTEEELLAAMERLQEDPEERRRLGERGYRAFEEKWSEDAHLEQYFAIIEELMEKKRKR